MLVLNINRHEGVKLFYNGEEIGTIRQEDFWKWSFDCVPELEIIRTELLEESETNNS